MSQHNDFLDTINRMIKVSHSSFSLWLFLGSAGLFVFLPKGFAFFLIVIALTLTFGLISIDRFFNREEWLFVIPMLACSYIFSSSIGTIAFYSAFCSELRENDEHNIVAVMIALATDSSDKKLIREVNKSLKSKGFEVRASLENIDLAREEIELMYIQGIPGVDLTGSELKTYMKRSAWMCRVP